jgi:hypothetical protein
MVANYRDLIANPPAGVENIHRVLWEAQRISGASLHPDSGDVIPAPFRMSGYVPFNGPICVAMVASKTTPALLFWSWVNQSQNALVNYFNRNASSEMSNETMMKSYGIAVASALTVAFGLATFVQRRYDPVTAKKVRWQLDNCYLCIFYGYESQQYVIHGQHLLTYLSSCIHYSLTDTTAHGIRRIPFCCCGIIPKLLHCPFSRDRYWYFPCRRRWQ